MRNFYHILFISFSPLSANHVPHILPKSCSVEHLAKRFPVQNVHFFSNKWVFNKPYRWLV